MSNKKGKQYKGGLHPYSCPSPRLHEVKIECLACMESRKNCKECVFYLLIKFLARDRKTRVPQEGRIEEWEAEEQKGLFII